MGKKPLYLITFFVEDALPTGKFSAYVTSVESFECKLFDGWSGHRRKY